MRSARRFPSVIPKVIASEQAIENLRDAVTVYLDSFAAHGVPLPVEDILIKPLDIAVTA
jgi:hypothetical protein